MTRDQTDPIADAAAGGVTMAHQGFSRASRIRSRADFERLYRQHVFATDRVLVVRACQNQRAMARLGLSLSRRVGNAVLRNRWKRLIREAFRRQRAQLPSGLDLVVRPRKGAQPDYHAVFRSLGELAWRVDRRLRKVRHDHPPR
jgi:ribonuclease P protein component